MRRLGAALLLGLGSFALVLLLHVAGVVERLELLTLDARYASGVGRRAAGADIVVAWIDQDSMDYLRRNGVPFPWPRSVYAEVQAALEAHGARAVVYDVLFDQPGEADDDRAFAAVLAGPGAEVLALKFVEFRDGGFTDEETALLAARGLAPGNAPPLAPARGAVLPLPELTAAAHLGFVNVRADRDKVYRRYDLFRTWRGKAYPSLALAAAMAATNEAAPAFGPDRRSLRLGAGEVPVDSAGRLLLAFRGGEFRFEHVKFVNILESINRIEAGAPPLYDLERFRGKFVLIGINAEGYEDVHPTPLSRLFPGVELHATALDNLLRGDALRAPAWDLPLAAAAATLATATVFLVPGVPATLAALGVLVLALLGTALAFWQQLVAVPVAAPALAGGLAAGAAFLYRLIVEGRQRRVMRRAFASYLAPEVLTEVLRDPERIALGGETREVTLLFTDLAGFTGLAEHVGPEALVRFLNEYFTRMCAPLLAERGVIDKFIGDAIMALFGAPLASPDHATRAVRAALAARAVSETIRDELVAAGRPSIETRIGIHSGPAVVGNMGSAQRFDYTAIGDTVNLASRLEGANKAFGTACLVSETAWAAAGAEVLGREVGLVGVKGRAAPIRVFEPIALAAAASPEQRARVAEHDAALRRLRAGDPAGAGQAFAALAARDPSDALARLYVERLAEPRWDGVFRLDAK
ncbi:MAG: adenylate/guanylate cyclase domain-containing protein [Planctomycetes bacterium]|nr:adenylate/guanylate cyclase domain-containing protein [Planctomycetota bacterium]